MGPQLLTTIEQIAKEKGIDKNIIIDALEQALILRIVATWRTRTST